MDDIRQSAGSKRTRVFFVSGPRPELKRNDCLDYPRVHPASETGPLFGDLFAREIRIPRESPKPVEVCSRQMMSQPCLISADVAYADETAKMPVEGSTRYERLDRRPGALRMHVEIEHLFPHRHQETEMALLACILLRNLEFNRLVRSLERAKQGRGWFAHLKIYRPMLDLKHDVVVEPPIERVHVVVSGASPVVLWVAPVHLVVVHKPAIKDDAAVRLERAGDDVCG